MERVLPQRAVNIRADHLAKKALLATHASNQYFNGVFPLEDFQVHTDGPKLTGLTKTSLEEHWGRAKAMRFLMSMVSSGPPSLIPFGGLAFIGRLRATPKCSGSSSPNRYWVGAAPTTSSCVGTPVSIISAQIVE